MTMRRTTSCVKLRAQRAPLLPVRNVADHQRRARVIADARGVDRKRRRGFVRGGVASPASSSRAGWLGGQRLGGVSGGTCGCDLADGFCAGFAGWARSGREVLLCGGEGSERCGGVCGIGGAGCRGGVGCEISAAAVGGCESIACRCKSIACRCKSGGIVGHRKSRGIVGHRKSGGIVGRRIDMLA